ncbi:MAG: hypothetical protein AAGK97_07920 [Bacteroidota bacterium]
MKIIIPLILSLLFLGCNKEEIIDPTSLLINAKGWYTAEMTRTDLDTGSKLTSEAPYIIIGEYGSGFKLKDDGVCHINYSDGSHQIVEGSITRKWELENNTNIIFTSEIAADINAEILEINEALLHISYVDADDIWEYKLKRIE